MLEDIKFSIIIPTYNRSYCVLNAIDSVFDQKYKNYEIIIVDDGSTDNTKREIEKIIVNNKVFFYESDENRGPNISRNIGADNSTGDWLVFLDSDDRLIDDALEKIKKCIINKKCDLLFIGASDFNGKDRSSYNKYSGYITYKEIFSGKLKNGMKIKGDHLPCVKKNVFQSVRFYEDIIGGEGLTWKRIAKKNIFYTSNENCLLVDSSGENRLSNLNNKNLRRILKIKIFDIKENFQDYLVIAPKMMIMNIGKIAYYFTIININNVRNFWFNKITW